MRRTSTPKPDVDADTLLNLGPFSPMAGIWEGTNGIDEHPVADGVERNAYSERYELEPIDPQTNGPQLFYGLRYHTHIVKPGEVQTFHDQVGCWLWEPAVRTVTFTLGIPRGQVLLAAGPAEAESTEFRAEGNGRLGSVRNPVESVSRQRISNAQLPHPCDHPRPYVMVL